MMGAVLAMGYAAYTYGYKKKAKALADVREESTKLESDINGKKSLLSGLEAKIKAQNSVKKTVVKDKPTRFLSELINEINAKENGVRVSRYSSREVVAENTIVSLSLDLELESTFLDLATMIERLEDKYKFLEIKRLETSKVDDFLQKCKSNMSLSIYLDKERI